MGEKNKLQKSFTLIELLIVLAIVVVLAAVVIIAVNPGQQLARARNTQRKANVNTLLNALSQYLIEKGSLPLGIDTTLKMLGTSAAGCDIDCGGIFSFVDDSQSEFDLGSYSNSQWDSANSWLELAGAVTTGDYISSSKNAGTNASWNNFSWIPQRPLLKELPSNQAIETNYNEGNANMTGNLILLHMNEPNGQTQIIDSSGQGNNGTRQGNLDNSVSGRFNTGLQFLAANDYVAIPEIIPSAGTIEFWFKPNWNGNDGVGHTLFDASYNGKYFYIGKSSTGSLRFDFEDAADLDVYLATSGTFFTAGSWYHLVITWQYNSSGPHKIYVNGLERFSNTTLVVGKPVLWPNPRIGTFTYPYVAPQNGANGTFDEFLIYNRILTPEEISDHYKRGTLRLKFQVRSGPDDPPAGDFVGPDGTTGTYFSELNNNGTGLPSFSLNLPNNQYFQYKAYFETDTPIYSPELKSVAINTTALTAPVCLDLFSDLVPDYLAALPYDPSQGSQEKTYYVVQKTTAGNIKASACRPELGETISQTR